MLEALEVLLKVVIVVIAAAGAGLLLPLGTAAVMASIGWLLGKFGDRIAVPFIEWADPRLGPVRTAGHALRDIFDLARAFLRAHRYVRWTVQSAVLVLAVAAYPTWYIYIDGSDTPDPRTLLEWRPAQIGYVLDRNGLVTIRLATAYRENIGSEQVPEVVRQALVSAEDKRFWSHDGWDWRATTRAAFKAATRSVLNFRQQGASTITQQVARNIYLEDWLLRQSGNELLVDNIVTRVIRLFKGTVWTNNATRKVREIKYAVRLERGLTQHFIETRPPSHTFREMLWYGVLGQYDGRTKAKEYILGSYANLVYLGHGVYGVSYGARFYFGKDMEALTPDEAAFLASIIPAPGQFAQLDDDPSIRAEQVARRNAVLDRMAENGFLDASRLTMLKTRPLILQTPRLKTKTDEPAVVSTALEEMDSLGYSRSDLLAGRVRVHLTADRHIQAIVNAAALDGIYGTDSPTMPGYVNQYGTRDGTHPQIAVVVLGNRNADILAEFGGIYDERLHNYTLYNRAIHAKRQPGSTMKGIVAAAAVMSGKTPDDLVTDTPISVNMGGWQKPVKNYDGRYLGIIPLREAIAQSRNVPILRLVRDELGGPEPLITWAHTLGIQSELDPYISTALGASSVTLLEMTNAYRSLASGTVASPHIVGAVTDANGAPLYRASATDKPFPIPPEKLDLVQELLRGTVRLPSGTARSLDTSNFPIQVMGKTGTSNSFRDAWFICSTYGPDGVTIGIWVGYDDFGAPLANRATGGSVALPVAREIMLALYGPAGVLGDPPKFPQRIEARIDAYRARRYPELNGK
ncbi:MAG: transglycosylase domain-containing protein [Candidatus Yanofskybacteria bacterium]|nr:transglycosylase domain-containing protein [Candidatus Yanofskybacteria bacterium]